MPRVACCWSTALMLSGLLVGTHAADARCPEGWSDAFGGGSIDGTVYAITVFDDGTGEALYVGGDFKHAGGVEVDNIARFDGVSWRPVGGGLSGVVRALEVFDDGAGEALFAGGEDLGANGSVITGSLAKWQGAAWSNPFGAYPRGVYGDVYALRVHDDGSGAALFAAGDFTIGATSVTHGVLARWDGGAVELLSVNGNTGAFPARDLAVFDEGDGPRLFVSGDFIFDTAVRYVARWDGSSLEGLVNPVPPYFQGGDLAVATIGGRQALYFWSVPNKLWRWDGASLLQVTPAPGSGSATPRAFTAMTSDGTSLIAAGQFDFNGLERQNAVMRWDGSAWTPIATAYCGVAATLEYLSFDGSSRPYLGGDFTSVDHITARSLASFDGTRWADVGTPDAGNTIFGGPIYAIAALDGQGVAVGGGFAGVGPLCTGPIALWNGAAWEDLGGGEFASVQETFTALAWVGQGDNATLFARGDFRQDGVFASLASWHDGVWTLHPVDDEPNADDLFAFDDGDGETVYTGEFDKWNGVAWEPATGLPGVSFKVLGVTDVGNGPALYASAIVAGQTRLVRRDGGVWSMIPGVFSGVSDTFPSGQSTALRAVAAFAVDGGRSLFVGGNFASVDSVPASGVAQWNRGSWSDVGGGIGGPFGGQIFAFASIDNGQGPALVAMGPFHEIGGVDASQLAAWNGAAWSELGDGVSGGSLMTASFTDGAHRSLFIAGDFSTNGNGQGYESFARWGAPFFPGDANGDGVVDVGDLNAVLSAWMTSVPTPGLAGDVSGDAFVDMDDLNLVLASWEAACP